MNMNHEAQDERFNVATEMATMNLIKENEAHNARIELIWLHRPEGFDPEAYDEFEESEEDRAQRHAANPYLSA